MKLVEMSWKRRFVYAFLVIFGLVQAHSLFYFSGGGWATPILTVYHSFAMLKLRLSGVDNPAEIPNGYRPVQGDDLKKLIVGNIIDYSDPNGSRQTAAMTFGKYHRLVASYGGGPFPQVFEGTYMLFDDAVCTITTYRSVRNLSCRRYYQDRNHNYLLYRPPPRPTEAQLVRRGGREPKTGSWLNLEITKIPEDSIYK